MNHTPRGSCLCTLLSYDSCYVSADRKFDVEYFIECKNDEKDRCLNSQNGGKMNFLVCKCIVLGEDVL